MSDELYERAVAISQLAYAPYSNYFVGAAVRARDGRVFEGVNEPKWRPAWRDA